MVVTACTSANKVVVSNAGGSICVGAAIRLSGSAALSIANVGAGEGEVYRDKTATTFNLRTLTGIGGITVDINGDVVRIDGSAVSGLGEVNVGANAGGGDAEVYIGKVGVALGFRTLSGTGGITVAENGSVIEIDGSGIEATIDHGSVESSSLLDDDHPGHPWLLGRSGGQVLYGGTAAGDDLTLHSTSHGTKGLIYFGANSAYDQVNDRMGIGTTAPASQLNIQGAAGTGVSVLIETTDNTKSTLASFSTQDSGTKGAWDVGAYASSHATKAGVFFVYQGANNAGSAVNLERLTISQAGLVGVGNLEIASAGVLGWAGSTQLSAPADGVLLLTDAAGTNFDRFQIGGTTSSFPSLNRNAAQLEAKLADDSAYTNFKAATLFAENGFFVSSASRITSPVDGDFLFTDAAGTNFSMLQLGGTTLSFPALNRNAAQLEAKLADDSAYANFKAQTLFATNGFYVSASSRLTAPVDGNWLVTDAATTDFGLLQFGGTTSSFPALKRTSARFDLRLADDSGYTDLRLDDLIADGLVRWSSSTIMSASADGNLFLRDAAGTDFSLLQLGGTTSSFPAWKRVSAGLAARVADDSADADLSAKDVQVTGDLNHDGSNVGFYGTTPAAQSSAYTPTNVAADRAYDANATTVHELADVLGTLIADLQATGLIA